MSLGSFRLQTVISVISVIHGLANVKTISIATDLDMFLFTTRNLLAIQGKSFCRRTFPTKYLCHLRNSFSSAERILSKENYPAAVEATSYLQKTT